MISYDHIIMMRLQLGRWAPDWPAEKMPRWREDAERTEDPPAPKPPRQE